MSAIVMSYFFATLMVVLAGLAVLRSHRRELDEKANRHFEETAGLSIDGSRHKQNHRQVDRIHQIFWRAGLELKHRHVTMAMILMVFLSFINGMLYGWVAALLVPVMMLAVVYLWLWQRANRRIKAILFQLPLFLDQVLRALGTGRSMESALQLAANETPNPLKEIFERVLRANRLGDDLGQSIQQVAQLYRVQELYLVSLAIRVNRTYGSSVRDLLNNIVKMIHDREAARRELRTMTGETRVTAWVLGLLPLSIAGYIMMMNPDYMLTMWQEDSGRILLLLAVAFQALGAFTLWRMIKSI